MLQKNSFCLYKNNNSHQNLLSFMFSIDPLGKAFLKWRMYSMRFSPKELQASGYHERSIVRIDSMYMLSISLINDFKNISATSIDIPVSYT